MENNIDTPHNLLIKNEEEINFYRFCTFIYLFKGGNINLSNIFLNLIINKFERNLFKKLLCVDNDLEALKIFLNFAPHLTKSKYITKKINQLHKKIK